jgi:2-keto-4-pentenoate hydratase/2-oxohepta-3-ene-1,7-dioic acid hydratase in catechol pathway
VAGFSVFNDGSIRDYQTKSAQWMMERTSNRSGSFGPEFVTADELPPGASGCGCKRGLNGQVLQDANTRDMIFDVATLTPSARNPSRWSPATSSSPVRLPASALHAIRRSS